MKNSIFLFLLFLLSFQSPLSAQTEPTIATCNGDQYVCINSALFDLCVVIDLSGFPEPIDHFVITWGDGQMTTVPASGPLTQHHPYNLANFFQTTQYEKEFTVKLCTYAVGDPDPVCTATFITFLNPPIAQFTTSSPECIGQPVTFSNGSFPSQGLTVCPWDYGDGTTGTLNSHLYDLPGTYTVTLKVFNQCDTSTISHDVEVLNLPEANAVALSGVLDASADTLVVCLEGGGIVGLNGETFSLNENTYKWRVLSSSGFVWIPASPSMPIVPNPQIDFNNVGIYKIELKVDNPCLHADFDTLIFNVIRKPQIMLKINASACQPITFNPSDSLDDGNILIDSCHWDFGPLGSSTNCDPGNITFSQSTQVIFTACNACGCTSDTGMVSINSPGAAAITQPADTIVCSGESPFQLFATPPGGDFRINGVLVPNGIFNPAAAPVHLGTNIVTYGKSPCIEPDTLYLLVVQSGVSFSNPPDKMCIYDAPVAITTSPAGAALSGNGIDPATDIFSPAQAGAGIHVITATFADAAMLCPVAKDSIEIEVIALQAGFQVDSCQGTKLFFSTTAATSPFQSIKWTFGDGGMSTEAAPSHTYANVQTYQVSVTITSQGCEATASAPVMVVAPPGANFSLQYDPLACSPLAVTVVDNSSGDNLSYTWEINGTTIMGTDDPGVQLFEALTQDSIFTVKLTVRNDCGASVMTKSVTVHPRPFASFGVNSHVCSGEALDIQHNSLAFDSLVWDFGNSMTFTGTNPPPQTYFTGSDNSTIYITLYAFGECGVDTLVKPVIVVPTDAQAFFTTTAAPLFEVCARTEVCFESFSLPAGIPLIWDFGDGNTAIGFEVCHTWNAPGTYKVTARLISCGFDSLFMEITVLPIPTASFLVPPPGCPGEPVLFADNSTGAIDYDWDFGNGDTSSLVSPAAIYAASGTYEVCLSVTSENHCTHDTCQSVYISDLPVANFLFSDSLCAGDLVLFTSQASADVVACVYDFGDTNSSPDCNTSHTFTADGSYLVTQTVITAEGCPDDTSRVVFIRSVPVPDFSFQIVNPCHPSQVIFLNQSTNADGYFWDFGDGNTSTDTNPIHIYDGFGSFTVTLTAFKDGICERATTQSVVIFEKPVAAISPSVAAGCAALDVNFTSTSSGSISNYEWIFGDGFFDFTQNASHTYETPGIYTATLIVSNQDCKDTAEVLITVHFPFEATLSKTDILCHGASTGAIDLTVDSGTSPFNFLWSNGAETPDLQSIPAGVYSITSTDANDCTWADTIAILQPDALGFVITDEQVARCFGDSNGLICIAPQGGVAPHVVTWTNGVAGDCQINVPAGAYDFTIKDANGCILEDAAQVRQHDSIHLSYELVHISCFGEADGFIHLDSITGGVSPSFDSVRLEGPAGLMGGGSHFENLGPGAYHLAVKDSLNCLLELDLEIQERDSIWLNIVDSTIFLELGQEEIIHVEHNTDGPIFTWSPAGGLSCADCEEPTANPTGTQFYQLDLTDEYGCQLADAVTVEVEKVRHIRFPNIFTPNKDGADDYFFPLSGHPWGIKSIRTFRVFDQFGGLVFEVFDIKPNDFASGWDGIFKGKAVQPDTYVFQAEIEFMDGHAVLEKGSIILIR